MKFNPNQKVIVPVAKALAPTGGVVGLKGNLAPEGAIVKIAGLKHIKHQGPGAGVRLRGGLLRLRPGAPTTRKAMCW